MESRLIYAGLLLLCLGALLIVAEPLEQKENGAAATPTRASFSLPKMFDFGRFKRLFNKHYDSLVQEMARQKLFLARAFAAFVSAVNYKYRKSDYHLAINQMSDQTPEEMAQRSNRLLADRGQLHSLARSDTVKIEVANEEDVERELEDILKNKDTDAGLRAAAEELTRASKSRRKRYADPRDITLDDLMRPQHGAGQSPKAAVIQSNNPNYEPIELISFGSDDKKKSEIPESEASFINSLPGASFLRSMKSKLVSAFTGPDPATAVEEHEVYVDHRDTGCLTRPRDQGNCGSCYIFSTIALYEWTYCMHSDRLPSFSEQYLIDCGFRFGLKGCMGGNEVQVVGFVNQYGLELQRNYPYKCDEGTCPYPKVIDPVRVGYVRVQHSKLRMVPPESVDQRLRHTPILATLIVPPDFQDYGGGIHPGTTCDEDQMHAMLLVGSGRQDGKEYYLFRNSYDDTWGENGYFRLAKGSECLLLNESMILKAEFEHLNRKNPHYLPLDLFPVQPGRDPDAPPEEDGPVAGPVNNNGK